MQPANSDAKSCDTASEEWRRECEARWVLSLRTVVERREYLEKVERARGKVATEQLKRDILQAHQKKKVTT
jgi:hypothetical protein